ncbi:MAG: hypothetical protein LBD29_05060 [Treponema sp.]|jgi:hypothetical protein|nr:hypothetical protein [Treponema sp.]
MKQLVWRALIIAAVLTLASCEEYFFSLTPDPSKANSQGTPLGPGNNPDPNTDTDSPGFDFEIVWES